MSIKEGNTRINITLNREHLNVLNSICSFKGYKNYSLVIRDLINVYLLALDLLEREISKKR